MAPHPPFIAGWYCFYILLLGLFVPVYSFARIEKVEQSISRAHGGGINVRASYTSLTNDAATQELLAFLEAKHARGLNNNRVEIGVESSGLRGVFATRPFQPGDEICSIPVALILDERSRDCRMTDAQLGAALIKNILKGVWKPYLDSLPTPHCHFDRTPDMMSDENIRMLKQTLPTSVLKQVMERKQDIIATSLLEGIHLETLQFATWLVTSRRFTISRSNGQIIKTVLIPFLDMINHSFHPNAKVRIVQASEETRQEEYVLECTRAISAKQQIVIAYGRGNETSADLYVKYGFLLPEPS